MNAQSFQRTLQELGTLSNDFVLYLAPGSIALAHRDLCPSTFPCAFETPAFLSLAQLHIIKRRRRGLLRTLFVTFQLPIVLLYVDQTPQNMHNTLFLLASFFSVNLDVLGTTYIPPDTSSSTFPTIPIPVFFFNAYALTSRSTANSEPAKRAVSALLVSYLSANEAPPAATASALRKSTQASLRAGYIDIVSPIIFKDSKSNLHIWDGTMLRPARPPLVGERGNYLSTAFGGKQSINEDLPYGYVMQDCVIRMLQGSLEQTGHEAVKNHTGLSKGFEARTCSVLAALRTRPVDGLERNAWKEMNESRLPYMSTASFYLVDTRPAVVRGKIALVPFCVTPELQLICMLVVSMVVRPLGLGGAIALVGSGVICSSLCRIKWRDKWGIWGTRWSGGEALGHWSWVFTSCGMLVFPVLGILHAVEHVWTGGRVGMAQALLTIYMPGFLTIIRLGSGKRRVRMARDSVENTRRVVGDFLSSLTREGVRMKETEYLEGRIVVGSGEYVHAAHVPSDLLERWGEDYWYHTKRAK